MNIKGKFIITDIFRIVFVGEKEYLEKKLVFTKEKLYYHELIYNFSGKATIFFNNEVLNSVPGSVRYLPAGDCQKYVVEQHEYGDCIDVFFASNTPLDDKAFIINPKNQKLATLFKKIFSVWVKNGKGCFLECVSILYKIIAELEKNTYTPIMQFAKIQPAIEYIHQNFLSKEPITAEKLSSLSKISYSYVKRIFAQKFKVSPKRYILGLKMNYASELLKNSELTISDVADQCGYSDVYTFSHQYKTEFGLSPTDFRKKYKSSK